MTCFAISPLLVEDDDVVGSEPDRVMSLDRDGLGGKIVVVVVSFGSDSIVVVVVVSFGGSDSDSDFIVVVSSSSSSVPPSSFSLKISLSTAPYSGAEVGFMKS